MLRLPPHNTRHATFMQPFQCDLQPQLQAKNRTTQTGTTIVAKHIEGTKPFIAGCSHFTRKNTRFRAPASSPQHTAHATFMQPFQCDLQPQLQETHRTTHTGTTIVAKHIEGTKRPQPHPPHTRGTSRYLSSPAAATLHGKTQGFVLRLPPHNTRHATFMQPFQCDLQPQLQETHRTTHTGTTIVAKHIEGTKRPQPHPPHTRGTSRYLSSPAAATLHGKTEGFVLRLPPQNKRPCNIHAAIPMRSATTASRNA